MERSQAVNLSRREQPSVAVPLQIKQLTGSFLAVGLVGLVELVPAIVFGLWGGVLADAMSRRRLIIGSEMKLALLSIVLLVNALLPDPASRLWVLYMVAGLTAVFDGLQRPSLDALTPQIVRHDQLPAASALLSIRYTVGAILGPALAGLIGVRLPHRHLPVPRRRPGRRPGARAAVLRRRGRQPPGVADQRLVLPGAPARTAGPGRRRVDRGGGGGRRPCSRTTPAPIHM
ncbi:MFS transporter [Amorphoplanes digitatis]|uniref:MFS transporter n=1 Tax=Actinoplanes digitatis TaxID=1868 RepID=UPI0034DAEE84